MDDDISYLSLDENININNNTKSLNSSVSDLQIADDFGKWETTLKGMSNDYDVYSEEITPEVYTTTWTMIANEEYPCKFVKKAKGKYLYSCYFKDDHNGQIKARIIPSD